MWEAIFKIGSYILSWFTPERQTQRLKDEILKLKTEEQQIKLFKWSVKNEKRLSVIKHRIDVINGMLHNRAS
jgi:hypothetical protein